MFLGEYEYRIDDKGRLSFPARFREDLKQGMVLTRGLEKCIVAYPVSEWQKVAESMASLPLTRGKARRMIRVTFATAFSTELDGQGRVLLPSPLRQYAEINDLVVVAGVNNLIEIWSKELWESEKALMDEQAWHIAEAMEPRP